MSGRCVPTEGPPGDRNAHAGPFTVAGRPSPGATRPHGLQARGVGRRDDRRRMAGREHRQRRLGPRRPRHPRPDRRAGARRGRPPRDGARRRQRRRGRGPGSPPTRPACWRRWAPRSSTGSTGTTTGSSGPQPTPCAGSTCRSSARAGPVWRGLAVRRRDGRRPVGAGDRAGQRHPHCPRRFNRRDLALGTPAVLGGRPGRLAAVVDGGEDYPWDGGSVDDPSEDSGSAVARSRAGDLPAVRRHTPADVHRPWKLGELVSRYVPSRDVSEKKL